MYKNLLHKLIMFRVFAYETITLYIIKRCDKYVWNGTPKFYLIRNIESVSGNYTLLLSAEK